MAVLIRLNISGGKKNERAMEIVRPLGTKNSTKTGSARNKKKRGGGEENPFHSFEQTAPANDLYHQRIPIESRLIGPYYFNSRPQARQMSPEPINESNLQTAARIVNQGESHSLEKKIPQTPKNQRGIKVIRNRCSKYEMMLTKNCSTPHASSSAHNLVTQLIKLPR